MTLAPLTESRVRQIISEEILRENVDLIVESQDLFEADEDSSTTKAVKFVGKATVEMMKSKKGRQMIAGAMRLPLVLVKYFEKVVGFVPEKGADLVGAKKGGLLRSMIGGMKWLSSAPFKLAAVPLAKMANFVEDMDDSTANFITQGIEGGADEQGEEEIPDEEEPDESGELPEDPTEPAEPQHVDPVDDEEK